MGTVRFMAPECFKQEQGKEFNGKQIDIWAAGVTLYLLLKNQYPFGGNTQQDIEDQIMNQEPQLGSIDNSDIRNLLKKLLEKDPNRRIQVCDIINDRWVSDKGFDPVELD